MKLPIVGDFVIAKSKYTYTFCISSVLSVRILDDNDTVFYCDNTHALHALDYGKFWMQASPLARLLFLREDIK